MATELLKYGLASAWDDITLIMPVNLLPDLTALLGHDCCTR